jgi:protein gp37
VSGPSTIEWTERTWNPVTGCDRVSPGCDHCYALTLAKRLKAMGQARYQNDGDPRTSGPGFALTLHRDLVDEPRHWRRPSVVFLNSMSDLFHDRVPVEFIEAVFRTMAETPRHTYQVLTKRSARLVRLAPRLPWPPNVWMGVTVESQDYVIRARRLLRVPAAVRFLSCEPLIGPVDLCPLFQLEERTVDWVIAGGESGPGARPCEQEWLRALRDECHAHGVAYFLKQLGTVAAGGRGKGGHEQALLDGRLWREMPGRG